MKQSDEDRAEGMAGCGEQNEYSAALVLFLTSLSLLPFQVGLLNRGGVPLGGAYTAVVISAALGTLLLGLCGNVSLAVGPSLAINTFLVYTLVLSQGMSWPQAMGCLLLAALLLLVVVWRGWYEKVAGAVPVALLAAIRAGMGLLLIVTALEMGHLIVPSTITATAMGDLADPVAFLSLLGIAVTCALWLYGSRFAAISGVLAMFLGACVLDLPDWPQFFFAIPDYPVQAGGLSVSFLEQCLPLSLLLALLLSVENGVGLAAADINNNSSGLQCSVLSALMAALLGAGAFALVPAGLTAKLTGGKTGRPAVVAAVLLMMMVFAAPLAEVLAQCSYITVPAMLLAGFCLLPNLSEIDWQNGPEALSAMLLLVFFSLGNMVAGIGIGFIAYCLFKALQDGFNSVNKEFYGISLIFFWQLLLYPL